MTAGGESDIGSVDGMMPEEVEAAYQVFIQYFSSSKLKYIFQMKVYLPIEFFISYHLFCNFISGIPK